jgi:hypothetical protein
MEKFRSSDLRPIGRPWAFPVWRNRYSRIPGCCRSLRPAPPAQFGFLGKPQGLGVVQYPESLVAETRFEALLVILGLCRDEGQAVLL